MLICLPLTFYYLHLSIAMTLISIIHIFLLLLIFVYSMKDVVIPSNMFNTAITVYWTQFKL